MPVNNPTKNSNNLLPIEGYVRANTLAPLTWYSCCDFVALVSCRKDPETCEVR